MSRKKLIQSILNLISAKNAPISLNEISKSLEINSDSNDYSILKDILSDLENNQLIEKLPRRKYRLKTANEDTVFKGTFHIHHSNGYVVTENPEFEKIYIKDRYFNTALDGDYVAVHLHALKKGKKPKGEVVEIISRKKVEIVGKIEYNDYFYFLVPDDRKFYIDFLIPKKKLSTAKIGDKVKAKFLKWDDPTLSPTAEVIEVIGKSGIPVVEYDSIIKEFDLPTKFPSEVINEAKSYKVPSNRKPKGRIDLRNELIITIDPTDARDFDDALSLKILDNGNYYLGVHIADVSHYVTENSELDIEARYRGNSVYLVDRVIPMLPEELSNEICSLKPDEPRFAFSCFMEIDTEGIVVDYSLSETIMINKRRYTYDEALEIIETGKGDNSELILKLYELSNLLREKRFEHGGIDFSTREYRFVLDENKFPIDVLVKTTTKSTALIEECMLIANKTVAHHFSVLSKLLLQVGNLPCLYRIHEPPETKKLIDVIEFIKVFGAKKLKKNPSSRDVNNLLKFFEDMPEKSMIHQIIIRAMAKAVYSNSNIGHYGLGFEEYVHFTSPIRRYPDLIIHRFLKEYMTAKPEKDRLRYLKVFARDASNHCSQTERVAMEAERASVKLAHSVMASNFLGEDFEGIITGVTGFGLFVQIEKIYAEGLLHIKDLNDDYYVFDEQNFRLVGRKNKQVFSLGSKIKVKLVKVNIDKRTIDFAYLKEKKK